MEKGCIWHLIQEEGSWGLKHINLHCSPWGKPLFFGTELNLKVCQVWKGLRNVADVGAEDFKWNNDGHFREQNAEGTCGQVELGWGIGCSNGQVGQVVQQKTSLSCSSHHRNHVFNVFLSNFGSAWHKDSPKIAAKSALLLSVTIVGAALYHVNCRVSGKSSPDEGQAEKGKAPIKQHAGKAAKNRSHNPSNGMANCEMYWNILKCKCWPTWRPWESSSTANRMRIFQTPNHPNFFVGNSMELMNNKLEAKGKRTKASWAMRSVHWDYMWRDRWGLANCIGKKGKKVALNEADVQESARSQEWYR